MSIRDDLIEIIHDARYAHDCECDKRAPDLADAADAIMTRYPHMSADQTIYGYAASLRQQLLDTRAELARATTTTKETT